ncbi:MAG: hypothetical protein CL946_10295 [Ectothiorhodospiraceae bacterium]|nr:hypothetical protein [Ectothiorhodospiraceae bacterium]
MKRILARLTSLDFINIIFFAMLVIANIVLQAKIEAWWMFVLADLGLIALIILLARISFEKKARLQLIHSFYSMICVGLAFKQMYYIVPAINPNDLDHSLIAIDYWLFGVHPTRWIYQFSHPVITELLQIAYGLFYLLPLLLIIDLYKKKRYQAFKLTFMLIVLGFYLSYFGYVAVPAIGPRFTLHDFDEKEKELPGLFFTEALRAYVNSGESIPPGTENPAQVVQRDVFPSGHTLVTLLVMWLAYRYRARTRWFLWVTGSMLIIATVYMRYHYVIDLVGGALFALLAVKLGLVIHNWWCSHRRRWAYETGISMHPGIGEIPPAQDDLPCPDE